MARVKQQQGSRLVRQTWQRTSILALAAAGGMIAFSNTAFGTTYSWLVTASTAWATPENWSPLGPPPATPPAGDTTDLVFGGTVNYQTVQNTGIIDVNSITFNGAYSNGSCQLSGSTTIPDQFIRLGAGGINAITVSDALNGGTVNITSGAFRKIILTANQTWHYPNATGMLRVARVIENDTGGSFQITKTGAGTLSLETNNSTWNGGINIMDGYVRTTGSDFALGTGNIISDTASNTGIATSGTVDQTIQGSLTLGGAGSFAIRGSNAATFNGPVILLSDKVFATNVSNLAKPVTINGVISGNFVISKTGSGGVMIPTAANQHGGFIVESGILRISADNQLGAAGAPMGLSGGTAEFTAAINSNRNITGDAGGGSINGGANNLVFANMDTTGHTRKYGSGNLTLNRARVSELSVEEGKVVIAPGAGAANPNSVSTMGALNLVGGAVPTTTLDLTNNALLITPPPPPPGPEIEPFDTIRAQIISAYAGGAWTGPGITSSQADATNFALGYGQASDLFSTFPQTYLGQEIDATTVIVRFTRYGDADLSGTVGLDDFNRLATNFNGTGQVWTGGDFNYDGNVNLDDFNLLAGNFNLSAGPDGVVDPEDWSALLAAIPEPTTALLGVVASATMLLRRRRM